MPVQGCSTLRAAPRRRRPSEALPPRRPGRAREVQARSSAAPRIAPPVCTAPGHGDSTRGRRTARHPWPRPWRVPGVQPRPRPSGVRARDSRGAPRCSPCPAPHPACASRGAQGRGVGRARQLRAPRFPPSPGRTARRPPPRPPGCAAGAQRPSAWACGPRTCPGPGPCAPLLAAARPPRELLSGIPRQLRELGPRGVHAPTPARDVSGSKPRRPRGYGSRPKAPALTCVLVWPGCPARLPPPHSRGSWRGPLGVGQRLWSSGGLCADAPRRISAWHKARGDAGSGLPTGRFRSPPASIWLVQGFGTASV